ncbi:globin domain-containing protein [Flammeovirga aprica]|uniref:Hemin receptor n=1 Tax=Flammeovirga aprica JL-4 TaxID=694437 RepID=A0A7X9XAK4_9BACT|nr:globin domain-containing protein [Flammeovirga aprica]NME69777.1 hemin receptor [Flammeovirga aprica JL-4]
MKTETISINSEQIGLIQETYALIERSTDDVAKAFYNKLFELDPSLRRLFSSDMREQRKKLMDVIGFLVYNLNDLDHLVYLIQELGKRHTRRYEVKDHNYEIAIVAFLHALEDRLGNVWTIKVHRAWKNLLIIVSELMTNNKLIVENVAHP